MQASPTGKAVQRYEKKQTMQIPPLPTQQIVHVAGALLEAEKVRQGGCVGRDTEAVRFPLTGRDPGNGNVEAVQVIIRTDLGGRDPHRHQVKAAGCGNAHPRSQLDIAVCIHRLGETPVLDELVIRVLVRLGVTETVAETERPGRIRIHVVQVTAGDVFSRNRMVVNPLVGIRVTAAGRTPSAGIGAGPPTIITVDGPLPVERDGRGQAGIRQPQGNAFDNQVVLVNPLAALVHGVRVEIQVTAEVDLVEQVRRCAHADIGHFQGVRQEVVASVDRELVQDLDLLGPRAGRIPEVSDLRLDIVAEGYIDAAGLATPRGGHGIMMPCDRIDVVHRLRMVGPTRVIIAIQRTPAIERLAFFRAERHGYGRRDHMPDRLHHPMLPEIEHAVDTGAHGHGA